MSSPIQTAGRPVRSDDRWAMQVRGDIRSSVLGFEAFESRRRAVRSVHRGPARLHWR